MEKGVYKMEKGIEKRTKWILAFVVVILAILLIFYMQFSYAETRLYGEGKFKFFPTGKAGAESDGSPPDESPPPGGTAPSGTGSQTESQSVNPYRGSSGTTTKAAAPSPVCGNGIVQAGEECDNGQANSQFSTCTSECKWAVCGDGFRYSIKCIAGVNCEECDDGNTNLLDECDTFGQAGNTAGLCTLTRCGDGVQQQLNGLGEIEECDDGNLISGDGCNEFCERELGGQILCGNNICNIGEAGPTGTCCADCPGTCGTSSQTTSSEQKAGGDSQLGNVPKPDPVTYIVQNLEPLKEGQFVKVAMKKGDQLRFFIRAEYSLEILEVLIDSVRALISPPPQEFTLQVSKIQQISLSGGIIALRVDAIDQENLVAYIAMVSLKEKPFESPEDLRVAFESVIENEQNQVQTQAKQAEAIRSPIIIIAVIIGLLIIVLANRLSRSGHSGPAKHSRRR